MTLFQGGCHKLYVTGLPSKLGSYIKFLCHIKSWELFFFFKEAEEEGDVRETQRNNPIESWEEERQRQL